MAPIPWTPPRYSAPFGLLENGQVFLSIPPDEDTLMYKKISSIIENDEEYNADSHIPENSYLSHGRYRWFDYWTLVLVPPGLPEQTAGDM